MDSDTTLKGSLCWETPIWVHSWLFTYDANDAVGEFLAHHSNNINCQHHLRARNEDFQVGQNSQKLMQPSPYDMHIYATDARLHSAALMSNQELYHQHSPQKVLHSSNPIIRIPQIWELALLSATLKWSKATYWEYAAPWPFVSDPALTWVLLAKILIFLSGSEGGGMSNRPRAASPMVARSGHPGLA